jgi:phage shock protein A
LPERVQNKRGICLWDEDEWDAGCRRGEFPWEGTNPAFFYGLLLGSPAHLAMMGETSTTVPPETFTGTLHYTAPEGGGILPRYTHKLGGCWFPEDPTISLLKQVSKLKQKCKAAGQKVATVLYLNQHLRDENTQLQVAHTALDQELARVKLGNPGPCENPYAMWEKAIAEKTNRQVCLGRICIYLGVDSSRTQLDVLPELVREEIAQKNKAKDDNKVLAAQLRECQDKVVELQRKMEEKIQHPEVPYWFDSICGHLGVESSSTSGLKLVGLVRDLVARANAVQTPTRQDVLGCLGLICVHLGTDPTNTKLEDIADLVRELVERENRVAGEKNILSTKAQELQRKVEEKDQQIASLGEHAGTVRHENIKLIGQLDSVRNLLTAPTPESKDQVV